MTNVELPIAGYWFYGLAGSGKTYASTIVSGFIGNSFIIDGDQVRRFISQDLGYSLEERNIQLNRMIGLAELVLLNRLIPIVSTVTMNQEILERCKSLSIDVVQIIRPMEQLKKIRSIYCGDVNVVGKQIPLCQLETNQINNHGDQSFTLALRNYVKKC